MCHSSINVRKPGSATSSGSYSASSCAWWMMIRPKTISGTSEEPSAMHSTMPRLPFLFTFRYAKHLQGSDVSFPGCPVGQFYQEALPRGIIGRILGLMPVQVIEMRDIDQLMAGAGLTHIPPAGCAGRHVVFIQNPIHREAKWRESRCLNRIQDHHFKFQCLCSVDGPCMHMLIEFGIAQRSQQVFGLRTVWGQHPNARDALILRGGSCWQRGQDLRHQSDRDLNMVLIHARFVLARFVRARLGGGAAIDQHERRIWQWSNGRRVFRLRPTDEHIPVHVMIDGSQDLR